MSANTDADSFYDGLVRHGLIIPVGVPGAFGRSAVFERVLERFDALVAAIAKDDNAESCTFPPIINRELLQKVEYLDSFPNLCGAIYSFFGNEADASRLSKRVHDDEPWSDLLGMTDVALNPAACYPLYPTITGTLPPGGRLVTMLNWVYRHEPSPEPTRMQAFRIREFVRVGTREAVVEWRDMWLRRGIDLVRSLGLPATSEVASDPFFGRAGKMLAASQKEQQLKFEVLVPVISTENPTAVCSFNFHQDHFGSTFDIRTESGEVANTACLGFGLERIVMALFKTHGFEPDKWPSEARARLWD